VVAAIETPEVHRLSLDEYHQLIESGGFDEDTRVELIEGLLLDMSPRTRAHERPIVWLNRTLQLAIDHRRFELLVAAPLTLAASEPEPDFAVVSVDVPRPYHPGTASLVIEVSASSQRRDLRVKPRIYADAGIPLYWVIDVDARRAVVHSDPRPGGYGHLETCGLDGVLTAPHVGVEKISLAQLFSVL
jgi:Uma2 family endonuclease